MNNIEFLVSGLKIVHPVNVLETGAGLVKLYMKVTKRLYNKYKSGHVSFFFCLSGIYLAFSFPRNLLWLSLCQHCNGWLKHNKGLNTTVKG